MVNIGLRLSCGIDAADEDMPLDADALLDDVDVWLLDEEVEVWEAAGKRPDPDAWGIEVPLGSC